VDFSLSDEQRLLIDTVRKFIAEELAPHEDEIERTGKLDPALARAIFGKSKALGLYAMNMPVELGGGGLSALAFSSLRRSPSLATLAVAAVGAASIVLAVASVS